MKKASFLAAITAVALSVSIFGVSVPAEAAEAPQTPVVTFTPPTCDSKTNKVTVAQHTADSRYLNYYRFAIYVDGQPYKQLNTEFRNKLFEGTLTAEEVAGSAIAASNMYGKTVKVVPYWLNKKDAPFKFPQHPRESIIFTAPGSTSLTNVTKLGEGVSFSPVDPGTLNCQPPAPPKLTEVPAAPVFSLSAARCENNTLVPNVMSVVIAGKNDHLRFVGTQGDKKISLNEALRQKLWANGKLTVQDISAAYPSFVFDYSKPISVQAYWFDKEQAYADTLYDAGLNLTVGESDRFIKLGEAQSVTFVDESSLNCAPKLSVAPPAPKFALVAAHCQDNMIVPNHMTVDSAHRNENLRFVAAQGDQKISLKTELRNMLWTNGRLTQADLQAAYPTFKVDYTKPLTVQAYLFDKEHAYAEGLYDTTLKLTVGKSDRFIKLGEAKDLTLVDTAMLKCEKNVQQPSQTQGQQSGENKKTETKPVNPKKGTVNSKLAKTGSDAGTLMLFSTLIGAAGFGALVRARMKR